MPDIYERLGVRPIVNARGSHTRLGGSLMVPEVLDAMRDAAGAYVVLDELQERASELIARATGAEAGVVTGGAAAGLVMGTAACIAGCDPAKIERLPDTAGMAHEAVMFRAHRNGYDQSVRAAGATIVDVGYAHGTLSYQLESALCEQTALVVYLVAPWASRGALSLEATCEIAHRRSVPVLVDAAATLPPAENLHRFVTLGADMVVFSGGKGLNGPQSSGILAGKADLIRAAVLNGSPQHSVGRPGKAAKEDIVGLMVALELFLERDHAADMVRWEAQTAYLLDALRDIPGLTVRRVYDPPEHQTPRAELSFAPETQIDTHELVLALEAGEPRVYLFEPNGPSARPNSLIVNTLTMRPGEERVVASVIRRTMGQS